MLKSSKRPWALVTGASSGIGKELAGQFAAHNTNIILVARDGAALKRYADELQRMHGVETLPISCDLSDKTQTQDMIKQVAASKIRVEYLINSAGFGDFGNFTERDWEHQAEMLRLNVIATTQLCHVFGKRMVERGHGRILNLASTAAFFPGPKMTVYYASKAYVLSFSQALAEELAELGVTVTVLCPGPTDTHFAKTAGASRAGIFIGRLPAASHVAQYGFQAMMAGKRIAVHRWTNRLMVFCLRFIPRKIQAKFIKRIHAPIL